MSYDFGSIEPNSKKQLTIEKVKVLDSLNVGRNSSRQDLPINIHIAFMRILSKN